MVNTVRHGQVQLPEAAVSLENSSESRRKPVRSYVTVVSDWEDLTILPA